MVERREHRIKELVDVTDDAANAQNYFAAVRQS